MSNMWQTPTLWLNILLKGRTNNYNNILFFFSSASWFLASRPASEVMLYWNRFTIILYALPEVNYLQHICHWFSTEDSRERLWHEASSKCLVPDQPPTQTRFNMPIGSTSTSYYITAVVYVGHRECQNMEIYNVTSRLHHMDISYISNNWETDFQ